MVKYLIVMDNNKKKFSHTKYLPRLRDNNMINNYNTNYNQRNNNIYDLYNKNQRFFLNRSTKISNNNNNLNNVIKISHINQNDLGYNIRNNAIIRRFNNKNNYQKNNSNDIIHPETYFENFFKNNSNNNLPRSSNNSLKKFQNYNSYQKKKVLNSTIQNTKTTNENILPYMINNNNIHFNEINNIGYKTVNEKDYFPNQNIPLNKTYVNTPQKSKTKDFKQENKSKIKYNFNYTTSENKKGFQKYKMNYPHIKKKICPLCKKEIDSYKFTFHYNLHPSLIFPGIFLGSYRNACHKEEIKNLEINYVLNCAMECYDHFDTNIKYLHLKLNDLPSFNIRPFLDKAADFINECKEKNGCILIHCQMGISRSTSCLIAYMIKYLGYSFMEALEYIKKKRSQVMPNYGFIKHLMHYENINKK